MSRPIFGPWLARAAQGWWSLGTGVGGAFTSFLPAVAHFYPDRNVKVNQLTWQMPIAFLIGAIVWRVIKAPFELWKEERTRADNLQFSIDLNAAEERRHQENLTMQRKLLALQRTVEFNRQHPGLTRVKLDDEETD